MAWDERCTFLRYVAPSSGPETIGTRAHDEGVDDEVRRGWYAPTGPGRELESYA